MAFLYGLADRAPAARGGTGSGRGRERPSRGPGRRRQMQVLFEQQRAPTLDPSYKKGKDPEAPGFFEYIQESFLPSPVASEGEQIIMGKKRVAQSIYTYDPSSAPEKPEEVVTPTETVTTTTVQAPAPVSAPVQASLGPPGGPAGSEIVRASQPTGAPVVAPVRAEMGKFPWWIILLLAGYTAYRTYS